MKTSVMVHCGNAPKMERVIDLTIALAKRDFGAVLLHVRKDFIWKTVGSIETISYDELSKKLPRRPEVRLLTIGNALSHGNGAMCEGEITFIDGDMLHFCMVAEFVNTAKNALVKSAHTYFVK